MAKKSALVVEKVETVKVVGVQITKFVKWGDADNEKAGVDEVVFDLSAKAKKAIIAAGCGVEIEVDEADLDAQIASAEVSSNEGSEDADAADEASENEQENA